MFKITGCLMIVFSSVMIFMKNSIRDKTTYEFLKQTSELCRYIHLDCNNGKNYPDFFQNIGKYGLSYYRSFSFPYNDKNNICITKYHIAENVVIEVESFFRQLGKRTKEKESEYLEYSINYFALKSDEYRRKYEKNRQLNFVTGMSAGIMIAIMIY